MSLNNLSIDGEFRYIVQWFNDFSSMERDDFIPVLVDYLTQHSSGRVYMNGLVNSVSNAGINDKPMSLFQCRIKLFREWSSKWPEEFKSKLQEKIIEIDSNIGDKIMKELKVHNDGSVNGNGSESENNAIIADENQIVSINEEKKENEDEKDDMETVISVDNSLAEVLNNESSVDDAHTIDTTTNAELVEQVQMQPQEHVTAVTLIA